MYQTVYVYGEDAPHVFKHTYVAQESPAEPGKFIKPTNSTLKVVPPTGENEAAVFLIDADEWLVVPDFSGHVFYNQLTGDEVLIDFVGVVPENLAATPPPKSIEQLKIEKNDQINASWEAANTSTFQHLGVQIGCDSIDRMNIEGTAGHVALFGALPPNFPGFWKTADNSIIPMETVADFRAMYSSMTAQGTENFAHAQSLKAELENASTVEEIELINW